MNGTRLARNASAAVVAGIAAWSSYSHMVHVALRFGERPEVAWLLPFSVDGMLVVASVAMVDDKRSGRRVRPMARIAFAAGVAASIAANIAAAQPTWGARVVAAWPALALLLVVEMLSRSGRAHPAKTPAAEPPAEPPLAPEQVPAQVPEPLRPPLSDPEVPADVPVTVPAAVPVPPQRNNASPRIGSRRPAAVTRQLAADILDAEPGITRKEVATRLGVSTRRLREVLTQCQGDEQFRVWVWGSSPWLR
jgi:Protein of unknown function (DUF2637)